MDGLNMATIAEWVRIDAERVIEGLQDAREMLDTANGELVLDFSSVRRIDPGAVRALQALAATADEKTVKVVLRGVNIEIYKVLKLVKLTRRFSFVI
jgi:anti-anti-sigma regulatory factor